MTKMAPQAYSTAYSWRRLQSNLEQIKEQEVSEEKKAATGAGNIEQKVWKLQLMAPVYDHFPWILWPPAVSLALCGIPALQQAGTRWYTDTGKQLNKQPPHTQTLI